MSTVYCKNLTKTSVSWAMSQFAPREFRRLPINLLRDQNYPKYPDEVGQSAQDFLDGAPEQTILNQRIGYSRWKDQVPYGSNVVGLVQALENGMRIKQQLQQYAEQGLPIQRLEDVSEPLNQIPGPSPVDDGHLILSRDATPLNTLMTANDLNSYVQQGYVSSIINRGVAVSAKAEAMSQIMAAQDDAASKIYFPAVTPWGMIEDENT